MDWVKEIFAIEYWQAFGIIIGTLLAGWTLWKRLKPEIGAIMKTVARKCLDASGHYEQEAEAHGKIFAALEALGVQILSIIEQFENNDGSSIRDSLDRVEDTLAYQGAFQMSGIHTEDIAIFITDAEGSCTYVNREHSRLTEFRPDECMGREWINVIEPKERDIVLKDWKLSVSQGVTFERNITYVKPGGINPYRVHVQAAKIQSPGPKGTLFGYRGTVTLIK